VQNPASAIESFYCVTARFLYRKPRAPPARSAAYGCIQEYGFYQKNAKKQIHPPSARMNMHYVYNYSIGTSRPCTSKRGSSSPT